MKTTFASTALFVMLAATLPHAEQSAVHITFNGGRVTLTADHALLSDVLAEWARVGGTLITGTDKLRFKRVTIDLVDVDEQKAIEAVIGSAAGYAVKLHARAPVESSVLRTVVIFSRTARPPQAAPAPVIDKSIPESQYVYPSPLVGDLDAPAAQQLAPSPSSTAGPAPATDVIPELRFKYAEPIKP